MNAECQTYAKIKCQCAKVAKNASAEKGNMNNLMVHLKEHYAELYVEALSAYKPRDTLI